MTLEKQNKQTQKIKKMWRVISPKEPEDHESFLKAPVLICYCHLRKTAGATDYS